jgi:hypothetical protein
MICITVQSESNQRESPPNTVCTRPSEERRDDHGGGTAARGDCVRVFEQFVWLEVGSGKTAFSRPAHPYP